MKKDSTFFFPFIEREVITVTVIIFINIFRKFISNYEKIFFYLLKNKNTCNKNIDIK